MAKLSRRSLVGTWKLIASERVEDDGSVSLLMGRRPKGYLLYDASGRMSVCLMAEGRKRFKKDSGVFDGTVAERAAAAGSYVSYAGRYEVKGDVVLHHVEVSLFPNWVGTTVKRRVELSGRRLVLTTEPYIVRGRACVARIIWTRA